MKKRYCPLLFFFLALTLIFLLSACALEREPSPEFWLDELPPAEPEEISYWLDEDKPALPAFWLTEQPQIEAYQPAEEIVSRWYAGDAPGLLPRDDYGELYIYVGRRLADGIGPNLLYGLCDSQGRIVTDPVYISIQYFYLRDGSCLLALEKQPPIDTAGEDLERRFAVAASDGSWLLDDLPGRLMFADADWLILYAETADWDLGMVDVYIFNYDGEQHGESREYISAWDYAEGLIKIGSYDNESEEWTDRLLSVDGELFYPAQDEINQRWGLKDVNGYYTQEPRYLSEDELYKELGFTDYDRYRSGDYWNPIKIEGKEYTITANRDGVRSVIDYTNNIAGLIDADGNWLQKIKVRDNI